MSFGAPGNKGVSSLLLFLLHWEKKRSFFAQHGSSHPLTSALQSIRRESPIRHRAGRFRPHLRRLQGELPLPPSPLLPLCCLHLCQAHISTTSNVFETCNAFFGKPADNVAGVQEPRAAIPWWMPPWGCPPVLAGAIRARAAPAQSSPAPLRATRLYKGSHQVANPQTQFRALFHTDRRYPLAPGS